jgi:ribosome-binding ATPase YchF (GTP1/OBG family)
MLIGIVGGPNRGKSTLFKSATLANVLIANYPFATIEPNKGFGFVRIADAAKDFGKTANPRTGYVQDGFRFVPVELLDVAGLVPGAHEGKGRGMDFLDDLNMADALVQVIDVSGSVTIEGEPAAAGTTDPAEDIRFLEVELDHWYLRILRSGWDKFARTLQTTQEQVPRAVAKQLSGVRVTEDIVVQGMKTIGLSNVIIEWSDEQLYAFARYCRVRTKPMLVAANKIDRPGAAEALAKLKQEFPHLQIIGCSAEVELALKEASKHGLIEYVPGSATFTVDNPEKLSPAQAKAVTFMEEFLKVHGGTGVQQLLDMVVFAVLKCIAVHPGGASKLEDSQGRCLPDCFVMPPNTTALDFAFRLHTDFGNKFIRAIDCRTKLPRGKEYLVKHLDILEIVAGR